MGIKKQGGNPLPEDIVGVDNKRPKLMPLRAEYLEKRGGNLYGDAPYGIAMTLTT